MSGFAFVDLFAGIGGFHRAMSEMGGSCALACEIDPLARRVYASQFPGTPMAEDVRSLTREPDGTESTPEAIRARVPAHDVLCAGFPCQPFSKSGAQMGLRDRTRGTLFFDVMEIVRARRPARVLLENVPNLAGPRHRSTWQTIHRSLAEEGYDTPASPVLFSPHLLPPGMGGAPQIRDRVYILAKRSPGGPGILAFPGMPYMPVAGWSPRRWRADDVLEPDPPEGPNGYGLRPEEEGWLEAWNALVQAVPSETFPGFPVWAEEFRSPTTSTEGLPAWRSEFVVKNAEFYRRNRGLIDEWMGARWGPLRQAVSEFPPSRQRLEWQARRAQPRRRDRDIWKLLVQMRPSGIRVRPPTYLPALVAINQTSIAAWRRRRITPREAASLQGFPADVFERAGVDDAAAYRQLGNAVNVGVVKFMARTLLG